MARSTQSPAGSQWLSAREEAAWRSYLRAHAELFSALNRSLEASSGLSLSDFAVLVHLSEAPGSKLRVKALADLLSWEQSRLSHHLSRMVKRDLVRRELCATDGRGSMVALTRGGRASIRAAAPHHAADVRRWFVAPLRKEDLEALRSTGERITGAVRAGGPTG